MSKSGVATSTGGADDEIHIVVSDEDGVLSGTKDTVLEVFSILITRFIRR